MRWVFFCNLHCLDVALSSEAISDVRIADQTMGTLLLANQLEGTIYVGKIINTRAHDLRQNICRENTSKT